MGTRMGLITCRWHHCLHSLYLIILVAVDRSGIVERTRKSVSDSNYNKSFVCTCSAGSSTSISSPTEPVANTIEDITLSKMSEKFLDCIKKRRNSIIIPIGSVQYGVCRHRALLFKVIILFW